eukprot:jgi/Mesvir1/4077/Mv11442-RA.1
MNGLDRLDSANVYVTVPLHAEEKHGDSWMAFGSSERAALCVACFAAALRVQGNFPSQITPVLYRFHTGLQACLIDVLESSRKRHLLISALCEGLALLGEHTMVVEAIGHISMTLCTVSEGIRQSFVAKLVGQLAGNAWSYRVKGNLLQLLGVIAFGAAVIPTAMQEDTSFWDDLDLRGAVMTGTHAFNPAMLLVSPLLSAISLRAALADHTILHKWSLIDIRNWHFSIASISTGKCPHLYPPCTMVATRCIFTQCRQRLACLQVRHVRCLMAPTTTAERGSTSAVRAAIDLHWHGSAKKLGEGSSGGHSKRLPLRFCGPVMRRSDDDYEGIKGACMDLLTNLFARGILSPNQPLDAPTTSMHMGEPVLATVTQQGPYQGHPGETTSVARPPLATLGRRGRPSFTPPSTPPDTSAGNHPARPVGGAGAAVIPGDPWQGLIRTLQSNLLSSREAVALSALRLLRQALLSQAPQGELPQEEGLLEGGQGGGGGRVRGTAGSGRAAAAALVAPQGLTPARLIQCDVAEYLFDMLRGGLSKGAAFDTGALAGAAASVLCQLARQPPFRRHFVFGCETVCCMLQRALQANDHALQRDLSLVCALVLSHDPGNLSATSLGRLAQLLVCVVECCSPYLWGPTERLAPLTPPQDPGPLYGMTNTSGSGGGVHGGNSDPENPYCGMPSQGQLYPGMAVAGDAPPPLSSPPPLPSYLQQGPGGLPGGAAAASGRAIFSAESAHVGPCMDTLAESLRSGPEGPTLAGFLASFRDRAAAHAGTCASIALVTLLRWWRPGPSVGTLDLAAVTAAPGQGGQPAAPLSAVGGSSHYGGSVGPAGIRHAALGTSFHGVHPAFGSRGGHPGGPALEQEQHIVQAEGDPSGVTPLAEGAALTACGAAATVLDKDVGGSQACAMLSLATALMAACCRSLSAEPDTIEASADMATEQGGDASGSSCFHRVHLAVCDSFLLPSVIEHLPAIREPYVLACMLDVMAALVTPTCGHGRAYAAKLATAHAITMSIEMLAAFTCLRTSVERFLHRLVTRLGPPRLSALFAANCGSMPLDPAGMLALLTWHPPEAPVAASPFQQQQPQQQQEPQQQRQQLQQQQPGRPGRDSQQQQQQRREIERLRELNKSTLGPSPLPGGCAGSASTSADDAATAAKEAKDDMERLWGAQGACVALLYVGYCHDDRVVTALLPSLEAFLSHGSDRLCADVPVLVAATSLYVLTTAHDPTRTTDARDPFVQPAQDSFTGGYSASVHHPGTARYDQGYDISGSSHHAANPELQGSAYYRGLQHSQWPGAGPIISQHAFEGLARALRGAPAGPLAAALWGIRPSHVRREIVLWLLCQEHEALLPLATSLVWRWLSPVSGDVAAPTPPQTIGKGGPLFLTDRDLSPTAWGSGCRVSPHQRPQQQYAVPAVPSLQGLGPGQGGQDMARQQQRQQEGVEGELAGMMADNPAMAARVLLVMLADIPLQPLETASALPSRAPQRPNLFSIDSNNHWLSSPWDARQRAGHPGFMDADAGVLGGGVPGPFGSLGVSSTAGVGEMGVAGAGISGEKGQGRDEELRLVVLLRFVTSVAYISPAVAVALVQGGLLNNARHILMALLASAHAPANAPLAVTTLDLLGALAMVADDLTPQVVPGVMGAGLRVGMGIGMGGAPAGGGVSEWSGMAHQAALLLVQTMRPTSQAAPVSAPAGSSAPEPVPAASSTLQVTALNFLNRLVYQATHRAQPTDDPGTINRNPPGTTDSFSTPPPPSHPGAGSYYAGNSSSRRANGPSYSSTPSARAGAWASRSSRATGWPSLTTATPSTAALAARFGVTASVAPATSVLTEAMLTLQGMDDLLGAVGEILDPGLAEEGLSNQGLSDKGLGADATMFGDGAKAAGAWQQGDGEPLATRGGGEWPPPKSEEGGARSGITRRDADGSTWGDHEPGAGGSLRRPPAPEVALGALQFLSAWCSNSANVMRWVTRERRSAAPVSLGALARLAAEGSPTTKVLAFVTMARLWPLFMAGGEPGNSINRIYSDDSAARRDEKCVQDRNFEGGQGGKWNDVGDSHQSTVDGMNELCQMPAHGATSTGRSAAGLPSTDLPARPPHPQHLHRDSQQQHLHEQPPHQQHRESPSQGRGHASGQEQGPAAWLHCASPWAAPWEVERVILVLHNHMAGDLGGSLDGGPWPGGCEGDGLVAEAATFAMNSLLLACAAGGHAPCLTELVSHRSRTQEMGMKAQVRMSNGDPEGQGGQVDDYNGERYSDRGMGQHSSANMGTLLGARKRQRGSGPGGSGLAQEMSHLGQGSNAAGGCITSGSLAGGKSGGSCTAWGESMASGTAGVGENPRGHVGEARSVGVCAWAGVIRHPWHSFVADLITQGFLEAQGWAAHGPGFMRAADGGSSSAGPASGGTFQADGPTAPLGVVNPKQSKPPSLQATGGLNPKGRAEKPVYRDPGAGGIKGGGRGRGRGGGGGGAGSRDTMANARGKNLTKTATKGNAAPHSLTFLGVDTDAADGIVNRTGLGEKAAGMGGARGGVGEMAEYARAAPRGEDEEALMFVVLLLLSKLRAAGLEPAGRENDMGEEQPALREDAAGTVRAAGDGSGRGGGVSGAVHAPGRSAPGFPAAGAAVLPGEYHDSGGMNGGKDPRADASGDPVAGNGNAILRVGGDGTAAGSRGGGRGPAGECEGTRVAGTRQADAWAVSWVRAWVGPLVGVMESWAGGGIKGMVDGGDLREAGRGVDRGGGQGAAGVAGGTGGWGGLGLLRSPACLWLLLLVARFARPLQVASLLRKRVDALLMVIGLMHGLEACLTDGRESGNDDWEQIEWESE